MSSILSYIISYGSRLCISCSLTQQSMTVMNNKSKIPEMSAWMVNTFIMSVCLSDCPAVGHAIVKIAYFSDISVMKFI